jgi:hypothetical protein
MVFDILHHLKNIIDYFRKRTNLLRMKCHAIVLVVTISSQRVYGLSARAMD